MLPIFGNWRGPWDCKKIIIICEDGNSPKCWVNNLVECAFLNQCFSACYFSFTKYEIFLMSSFTGLLSISSLQVLSFKNGRAILLLNNFVIAHLIFPGGELGEEVESCFRLDLPPQTLERIVNVTFCRGILFLLDETGWIRIL